MPKGMPKVGDSASIETTITDEMVHAFAALSGDNNPIHLDDAYAAKTRFGRRIAHGILVGATLSRLAGMKLPGPGTIVIKQDNRYKAPCYIGETVTTTIRVVGVRQDKPIVKVDTDVRNQAGEVLIEGDAILYFDPA